MAQTEWDTTRAQIPVLPEVDKGYIFQDCTHSHACCTVGCGCCQEVPVIVFDTLELDLGKGKRLIGTRQRFSYFSQAPSLPVHKEIAPGYWIDTIADPKALRNYGKRTGYAFKLFDQAGNSLVEEGIQSISSHKGFYYIRINGSFGVLNEDFQWIHEAIFKEEVPQWFYHKESLGLLTVSKGGKYGLIDHAGEVILPFNYEGINRMGPHIIVENENEFTIYHLNKKKFIIGPFSSIHHIYDDDTKAHYFKIQDKNGKYGLVDEDGKKELSIKFDSIELSRLWLLKTDGKSGVYNKSFSPIVPIAYDSISMTQTILVKKDSLWGVFNYKGKLISECVLKLAPRQYNGFTLCRDTDGNGAGAIRTHVQGEIDFIPPTYSILSPTFPNRKERKYYFIVRHGIGGYGILEANANLLAAPEQYDEVKTKKYFHGSSSNLAYTTIYLRKGDLWALFEKGKELEFTITIISEEINRDFQFRPGVRTVIYFWK